MRRAVEKSKNVVAWKIFKEITPKVGLSYPLKMHFANIVDNDYYLSASLGGLTNGVTTVEMASAYATIENDGVYREPTCIKKITDSEGNVILKNNGTKRKGTKVYDKNAARSMTDILTGVLTSGTAAGHELNNMSCAGKTGTTNDKKDGWFCGFTPYYTTTVWVGYDSPRTLEDLYGSTYPLTIWENFMNEIHIGLENKDFVESESSSSKSDKKDAKGKVYYLNFKPEQDEQWQDLAKEYTKETGVDVTVLTAASGEYEKTLKSEMAKSNAPTLFQVNGPVGLASWKDYCYDLKDSDVAKQLTSDDFALMDGDKMSGIAYVIESYGIIYNKELLKKAGYSADDITNFDSFKKVVEDITANKDKLGFSAFTSAGMDGSSDWRFKTHLANLPIYYEYKDEGIDNTDAIKGTYLDNYRQIWDLYINNATCKPTELSTKTADDATADFVTGDAVFYQNGTWEYNNIKDVGDDNLGILPIYIGVEGEEDQGICTGTENYWCVNSKASEDDIQATLDFMNWCVTSDDGVKAMCKDMGFTIPFKKNMKSDNVLVNEANKYTEDGKTPVSWNFSTMPSEEWKNGVGSALTSYAADPTDANWAKVTTAFVDGWAKEAAAAK